MEIYPCKRVLGVFIGGRNHELRAFTFSDGGPLYAKVFKSLWGGSLIGQADAQLVFVFLLAHADPEGFADFSGSFIASLTGLPPERVRAALDLLESPDPQSRSNVRDGARLERLDAHRNWGWQIVNYCHYRTLVDPETVREQTRERVRKHRNGDVTVGNGVKRSVTRGNGRKRQAEVEVKIQSQPPSSSGDDGRGDSAPIDADFMTADEAFFEVFWPKYPRKINRAGSFRLWKSLKLKDDDDAALQRIMAALKHDIEDEWNGRPADKVPHPETWLRRKRWED